MKNHPQPRFNEIESTLNVDISRQGAELPYCFNRAIPHHPLAKDAMAPQLLVQRPADPAGAIPRALHLPALQPRGAAAHRVRPTPEEGQGRCMRHGTVRKQVSFDVLEMEMEMR